MNAIEQFLKRLGRSGVGKKGAVTRPATAVAPSPLMMALEPRVVYDASVAAVAAQQHAGPANAGADAHPGSAASNDATVPAAPKPVAEHDLSQGGSRAADGQGSQGKPAAGKSGDAAVNDGKVDGKQPGGTGSDETASSSTASSSTATSSDTTTSTDTVTTGEAAAKSTTTVDSTTTVVDTKTTDTTATAAEKTLLVASGAGSRSVVFIDSSVENIQTLIDGLPQGTEYVILNSSSDGFAQMADYLQAHPGADAIHLISHGSDGTIHAGSTTLNASDLAAESAQLARLGAAMNAGGDFLIYGCDVAQSADGQQLVQEIASLTHLNVAASTDATGAVSLGGDWTLEYQSGTVHTAVIESAAAQAQYDALLAVTTETYDTAAANNFSAIGSSQFTLDGIVYTLDQAANTYAYNESNSPSVPSDITDSPTDGVLEINPDGASALSRVTISLANGHTFNLSSFDLSSLNGDLFIQAHYANGTNSALIQLATAADGGYLGTVSSQLGSAFDNIVSFSLIDQVDSGSFMAALDNLTYQDTGPAVTTSGGSATWSSADNGAGIGGTPVAVDPGLILTDGGSSTGKTATIQITNLQAGDILGFTAQNGISGIYDTSTGTLTLSTGAGTATIAQWQAALESITFASTPTSPNLSTTTRTISFSFNDGTFDSNVATRNVTITGTDQTPVLSEDSATSTNYLAGAAATVVDANIHVSDGDNSTLASATITIASGFATGDALGFTNNNTTLYGDIHGTYNAATHALSMLSASGTATLAQWQAALDAVTFASSTGTSSGTRDITFAVSDGTKTSAALHHNVVVTAGPLVTTDSGSASFVTGDNTSSTPVAVDAGLTISDGSSSTLASATMQITGNFQADHDQLLFVNNPATMGDITGVYTVGTGELELTSISGTATLAQWQAALRSVTFTSDLVVPSSATRTISFQVDDGTLTSSVVTRTVTVTATDQTPIIGGDGTSVDFVAADNASSTPVVINNTVTVSDADGGPLHTATVTISANYQSTDALAFTNTSAVLYGNIVASYSNGVLTLTSSGDLATLAQWQNALRGVTYTSTAVTPSNASRTVTFSVSDGIKTSTTISSTVTVTDTDQTPLISGSSGSVTLTQGDNTNSTAVTVDNGIVVSDRDNVTLASATITIGNYDGSGDMLLFVNNPATMGDISGSYSNGVLTLTSVSSTATLAQWQAALRSIQFQNYSAEPDTTSRVITFVISDGTKTSSDWTRTVDVTLTDQTPLLTTSSGSASFTSGDNATSTPIAIDAGLTLSDSDSATMASATVSITGNFQLGEDVLALGSGSFGDITANFDAGTGVLTLTSAGASTTAQWVAALRSVTYTDTAVTPNSATRTISFTVSDGTKMSVAGTRTVTVEATHQTPVLTPSTDGQSYVPGLSAVTIDSGLALTDLNISNPSTLVSLTITVQVTSGFKPGDSLMFSGLGQVPTNGISPSYNPSTGTLTITSMGGTLAQWQSLLDNLQFQTGSSAPLGTRSIAITISDGVKTSAVVSYDLDVVSSAPSLSTTSTGSVAFVAGDNATATPVAVDANIVVADPLGNVVDTAVIAITGNLDNAEDVLGFTNDGATMGDISGTYNSLTGVLVLSSSSGTATLAQWQAALRAVTYTDTAVTPNTATRTIEITLSAATETSNTLTRTITVADTDQTPLVSSGSTGPVSFVAGDNMASTPVVIDDGITLSDMDNGTLASATVQIGSGFHAGEDVLSFTNDGATMGNIVATYDAVDGTLTLTSLGGSATLAQWQSALRAVTYTDTAVTPDTSTRSISWTVSDGTKTSDAYTRNVTVADTDQTPIVGTTSSGSASFVAGDNTVSTAVVVDSGVLVSDLDNGSLSSATVRIDAGFHPGEDVLGFVNDGLTMGNISASYDAATGTLTLSSDGALATLAQWQSALRSVTYTDVAITPDTSTRTISFVVNDGTKSSAELTRDITVTANDQTPVITSGSSGSVAFTAGDNSAGSPVTVDNGIALSDLDNATLASATVQVGAGFHAGEDVLGFVNDGATMGNITATYNAATGTLTLTSAGASATLAQWQSALRSVTYTDTAVTPATATRTIGFTVNDGAKSSTAITRDVTITVTDQTPVVSTGSTGSAAFVAGDNAPSSPVAVDAGITLVDRDSATLASATVQISGNYHPGEDLLAFANDGATMGNISASFDATTGTLTLTSTGATATVAQWQAALRAVTYVDTVDPVATLSTATRTVSFAVSDGSKTSVALSRDVTVANTDQTPLLGSTNNGSTSFVSGDNAPSVPVVVDSGITLSDRDNTALASATVRIGAGFQAGQDVLAFVNDGATMGNIVASYDAATGTLTLTSAGASATLAQWHAALRSVTYTDTAVIPVGATRSIAFTVNDGIKDSQALTRQVDVTATPQTPQTPQAPAPSTPPVVNDPVPPALISLLPPPSPFLLAPGQGLFANAPAPSRTASAPDSIAFFPTDLKSVISNPLIVTDSLADAPRIGAMPVPATITFTATEIGAVGDAGGINAPGGVGGSQAHGSLSRTTVESVTTIPAPDLRELALSQADQAVRVNAGPNEAFSVSLPLMVGAVDGPSAANAHVSVLMANGRPLPGWVRFDPVRGTLEGRAPAGSTALAIEIVVRDAAGHEIRRPMIIEFVGRPGHVDAGIGLPAMANAGAGAGHPAAVFADAGARPGHPAAARADAGAIDAVHAEAVFGSVPAPTKTADAHAAPSAKPSLSEQFARAHASLHVARPVAVASAAAAPVPADRPHA